MEKIVGLDTGAPTLVDRTRDGAAGLDNDTIETADGRLIYFHRNSVQPPGFEALVVGSPVAFVESAGDEGPQASAVRLLAPRRAVA